MSEIVLQLRAGIQIDDGNPSIGRPPSMLVLPLLLDAADKIEHLVSIILDVEPYIDNDEWLKKHAKFLHSIGYRLPAGCGVAV